MDRIAIISDIHGNVTALEAVLADIEVRGIKRVFCLGDIAGKGPGSIEAVDIVQSRCEKVVKGNWDYIITEGMNGEFPEMLSWHNKVLGRERVEYLRSLPMYEELYFSGRLIRLCHASPDDLFFRVFSFTPNDKRLRLFMPPEPDKKEADVVGYGDIHMAYTDSFEKKTIFNVGSVGNPLDFTLASYAIIEGTEGGTSLSPFAISIIRLPYDIGVEIKRAEASGMPGLREYIDELKTAVYRGISKYQKGGG